QEVTLIHQNIDGIFFYQQRHMFLVGKVFILPQSFYEYARLMQEMQVYSWVCGRKEGNRSRVCSKYVDRLRFVMFIIEDALILQANIHVEVCVHVHLRE